MCFTGCFVLYFLVVLTRWKSNVWSRPIFFLSSLLNFLHVFSCFSLFLHERGKALFFQRNFKILKSLKTPKADLSRISLKWWPYCPHNICFNLRDALDQGFVIFAKRHFVYIPNDYICFSIDTADIFREFGHGAIGNLRRRYAKRSKRSPSLGSRRSENIGDYDVFISAEGFVNVFGNFCESLRSHTPLSLTCEMLFSHN